MAAGSSENTLAASAGQVAPLYAAGFVTAFGARGYPGRDRRSGRLEPSSPGRELVRQVVDGSTSTWTLDGWEGGCQATAAGAAGKAR